MRQFRIDEKTILDIGNYLIKQPYSEVANLVQGIQSAKLIPEPEAPKKIEPVKEDKTPKLVKKDKAPKPLKLKGKRKK